MSVDWKLGPFVLGEPIGSGAMGTVYRAAHDRTGLEVAVKVVRLGEGADELALDNIAAEVRAVAALDHPNIVRIYDLGVVDAAAAEASGGKLHRGTPWYAMEHADEGSLRRRMRTMDWSELEPVLLDLLEGLGHAHARGVLHLDLKPANVLFGGRRPGPKLSDFGMGLVGAPSPGEDFVRGTPHYMAPEQVRGRWEDLGPWTDLYAVGCVAWRVVTGDTVIADDDPQRILEAQVLEEPGEFAPRFDAPEGLEAWVRRLLAKDPEQRFRFAADAARALRVLRGDGPGEVLPADWRMPESQGPADAEAETGLGLAAVREPPVVGRTRERELLWGALREAAAGRTRVVVIRGPVGSGKSRLARWLGTRAHEVGAAMVITAQHGPEGLEGEGLVSALRRAFPVDLRDADGEGSLGARLQGRGLSAPSARDVVALLARGEITDPLAGALGVPPWWESVADALQAVAWERVPVVILDDVQWGEASLDALRWMLVSGRAPPAAFVLTAEDEALLARPVAEDVLLAIEALPATTVLELGPLSHQARAALARRLLPLEPALIEEVAERSGGSPLFEVELVQDWAERRILEQGPRGLRLRRGATVPPPADLEPLWADHLEAALAGHPEWRPPIELAAVLGDPVDEAEWRAACAALGLGADTALVDALAEARLVRLGGDPGRRRWSFVHPMLRDAVATRAASEGRAEALHRACAAVIDPADRERRGLHLARGGRPAEAVEPLLEALDGYRPGETGHGEPLLRALEAAAAEALPPDDPRWGRILDHRTRLFLAQGRPEDAREVALRQAAGARTEDQAWRAQRNLVHVALELGDATAAVEQAIRAEAVAARLGDPESVAEAWVLRSETLRAVGRCDDAREPIEWAAVLALDEPAARDVAHEQAQLQLATGRFDAARRSFDALAFTGDLGLARTGSARAALGLGDAMLGLGDPVWALHAYRAARRRFRVLGHADELLAQVGLAMALVGMDREEEADEALARVRDRASTHRQQLRLALAEVLLRASRASDPLFTTRWREARALFDAEAMVDPWALRVLEGAASRAARPERARELKAAIRRWSHS